jgi:hypothetical protein
MNTNKDRVDIAAAALKSLDDPDTAVRDLLANLMHYCKKAEISFANELKFAAYHFDDEEGELS